METTIQANKVFLPVHKSKHRYVIMKGSAGSGKSVDTAQGFILRLLSNRGRNLLCIRKAEVTNRDSTYAELNKAINALGLEKYFRATVNPMAITCVNGNTVLFRGVLNPKERDKLKSIAFINGALTDVWIEEATELTQDDFEIIDDRLRGELLPGLFFQIKATFNPVSEHHWIKKVFFDRTDPDVLTHHSTYLDNRFVGDAYKRRMQRRKEVDPDGYEIYGLGNWGEVAGLILKNWEIRDISQAHEDYDDNALGQDFGFNHANGILDLGFKDDDIYIKRENCVYEKDTAEIIESVEGDFSKDHLMWCDSAEPDRIQMWKKAGYRARPVKKEKKSTSKTYVKSQIDWLKQRRIFVHPSCVNTIRELKQWRWRKDEQLNIWLDEPVPIEDDMMAALRYGVEGWRKPYGPKVLKPGGGN